MVVTPLLLRGFCCCIEVVWGLRQISLCDLDCPGTQYVVQADLSLPELLLPQPTGC